MDQFLQSDAWERFQGSLGRKTLRLSDGTLCLVMPLPMRQQYLYIPRARALWGSIAPDAISTAKQSHALFIRFEPVGIVPGGLKKVGNMQPAHTLILDLTKQEDQLLAEMHQKTRYNIRLAEKKKVVCAEEGERGFEDFWKLISGTYGRKGKRAYSKDYYKKLLAIPGMKLYAARVGGRPVAANLVLWNGDTATYLHGGSDDSLQSTMAPQALQWYQITEAKKAGLKFYDFWGIDEQYGEGIARFKKGFGGSEVRYPGTFEVPVNVPLYWLYRLAKLFRS